MKTTHIFDACECSDADKLDAALLVARMGLDAEDVILLCDMLGLR